MNNQKKRNDLNKLGNYMAVIAIVPAILSILAYELLDFIIHIVHPGNFNYTPLNGLGMLIPMALMMELFTFFFSKSLYKKVTLLINGMKNVAGGNFNETLNVNKGGPFRDAYSDFNVMTAELRSVQILRKDFINDFSHEFKTPITSINGFANLLLDTDVSENERRQYLQIIADESNRLAKLSENTILMSRLDSQQTIPDKVNFALDEQIKQDIILLSPIWNSKHIQLSVELEPITYFGNASLMTHVWLNLINNAITFTPEYGKISVTMSQNNNEIKVKIADNGKGMTKEESAYIFNKYYQADSIRSSKGLGLGLSITHRIIELCQGQIEVISTPNNGSTFIVVIPLSFSSSLR